MINLIFFILIMGKHYQFVNTIKSITISAYSQKQKRNNKCRLRVEKNQGVWTIIHSRPESRNAMDPKSADHLTDAFLEFNENEDGKVAVFWGEGGAFFVQVGI